MKNKLLITSALVTMVASGSALAETKITGAMTLGYKAISNTDPAKVKDSSRDGFGRETQLNVVKTGDLNNGLKYAAGFALEYDGDDTGALVSDENVHFNLISGDTTVSFGMDHLPNLSQSAAPRVAEHADTTFASTKNLFDYQGGVDIKESFAIGLMQNTDVGRFVGAYVPNQGDSGGNDSAAGLKENKGNAKGAYWLLYSGNAGVTGLDIKLAYSKEENIGVQDGKVKQYGIGYNFGRAALGVMVNDIQTATAGEDTKSHEFGATFALSDSLSAGINYVKTEGKAAAAVKDEKIKTVQVGYNMGPATVAFSYGEMENANGKDVADVDTASVRLTMGF